MGYLIGCDPEIFLQDQNQKFISAHGMIPGNKKNPVKVKAGAIQIDGTALEFNIDPAPDAVTFVRNIQLVMKNLEKRIKDQNPQLKCTITPTADYDPEYFKTIPPEALELGCDPDYNAYTRQPNDKPNADRPFRTGSGHIHIGWTEEADPSDPAHFEDCIAVTKALDNTLYIVSSAWDKDERRRELYGARGAFRPKPYGVEYRVLSNAWLKTKELQAYVFDSTQKTMKLLEQGQVGDYELTYHRGARAARELTNDYNFPLLPDERYL